MGKQVFAKIPVAKRSAEVIAFERTEENFIDDFGDLTLNLEEFVEKAIENKKLKVYEKLQKKITTLQNEIANCKRQLDKLERKYKGKGSAIKKLLVDYSSAIHKDELHLSRIGRELKIFKGHEMILEPMFAKFPPLFEKIKEKVKNAKKLADRETAESNIVSCINQLNAVEKYFEEHLLPEYEKLMEEEERGSPYIIIFEKIDIYEKNLNKYLDDINSLKTELAKKTEPKSAKDRLRDNIDKLLDEVDDVTTVPDVNDFFKKAEKNKDTKNRGVVVPLLSDSLDVVRYLEKRKRKEIRKHGRAKLRTLHILKKAIEYKKYYSKLQDKLLEELSSPFRKSA